jgi:hypothetical protein
MSDLSVSHEFPDHLQGCERNLINGQRNRLGSIHPVVCLTEFSLDMVEEDNRQLRPQRRCSIFDRTLRNMHELSRLVVLDQANKSAV